jgi:choline kinase
MTIARPTRAVVVAAGMGRRLAPYTDEMPKCLVPVRGRPMLCRALDSFRAEGLSDFVVVRGYRADVLERRRAELGPGVRFVENPDYERNNILQSLFRAHAELDTPFVFTYADIVFAPEVVTALMAARGDICLVVDRRFADLYEGRTLHPLAEAEVCRVGLDGAVELVGKRSLPAAEATGEFIGLAKFSAAGAAVLSSTWQRLDAERAGTPDRPFQRAPSWQNAFVTDLLQELIGAGVRVDPVYIDGRWREIDTVQDLERAEANVDW